MACVRGDVGVRAPAEVPEGELAVLEQQPTAGRREHRRRRRIRGVVVAARAAAERVQDACHWLGLGRAAADALLADERGHAMATQVEVPELHAEAPHGARTRQVIGELSTVGSHRCAADS
eukprot:4261810-Prymnesium_polylepis.1